MVFDVVGLTNLNNFIEAVVSARILGATGKVETSKDASTFLTNFFKQDQDKIVLKGLNKKYFNNDSKVMVRFGKLIVELDNMLKTLYSDDDSLLSL